MGYPEDAGLEPAEAPNVFVTVDIFSHTLFTGSTTPYYGAFQDIFQYLCENVLFNETLTIHIPPGGWYDLERYFRGLSSFEHGNLVLMSPWGKIRVYAAHLTDYSVQVSYGKRIIMFKIHGDESNPGTNAPILPHPPA